MRSVVIIGGGLTGLAAAWELERLGVEYTLVEVKPRLGGSIISERRSGFLLEGGSFVLEKYGAWGFLDELNLPDALRRIGTYRDGELVVFERGTASLVDALTKRLTGAVMRRMAVSSVGLLDGERFGVCLENGLLIDARAVIITAPARYAAHMLYSLNPEAALLLSDYQYEPIARVSLGYDPEAALRLAAFDPADKRWRGVVRFINVHIHDETPNHVPPGHVLVRAGLRLLPQAGLTAPEDALRALKTALGVEPAVEGVWHWAEADPLTRHLPEHSERMDAIEARLPARVALVGSDYRAKRLDQQIDQGRAAARRVMR